MAVDLVRLKSFLAEANLAGYATGAENSFIKETDGSKTIVFVDGDWGFNDNYFGGEPYGGREVVSYQGKPVFIMVYYGQVKSFVDKEMVYDFLRQALKSFPAEMPLRGPSELVDSMLRYENKWIGDITKFSGQEKIFFDGEEAYQANYLGGLVDQ
ncbi:MAG: DUF5680 domain-containing protein [Patescibacteria group bacterium]